MTPQLTQTLIAVCLVAFAALFIGRRWWKTVSAARTPKDGPGCGSGCGCGDGH
jgi:hypothetical protein